MIRRFYVYTYIKLFGNNENQSSTTANREKGNLRLKFFFKNTKKEKKEISTMTEKTPLTLSTSSCWQYQWLGFQSDEKHFPTFIFYYYFFFYWNQNDYYFCADKISCWCLFTAHRIQITKLHLAVGYMYYINREIMIGLHIQNA